MSVPSQDVSTQEFYTPLQDKHALKNNYEINVNKPDVLIIGDSISIGYTEMVRELLQERINVLRVKVNCGNTEHGLANIDEWLGDAKWDVIHFNWGLHDLCYRHPDSKVYGCRDKVRGRIAVPLKQYTINLEKLVCRLELTGAVLIFASTTIVPDGEPGRRVGDEVKYNEAAAEIMQQRGIMINDLHALTKGFSPELFNGPGDVHYTPGGSRKLAEQVAAAIAGGLL